jgi:hypothetical protein
MFDSNDWAKTVVVEVVQKPVSANTVPMVRNSESIFEKS